MSYSLHPKNVSAARYPKNSPIVSVILPVYNAASFLRDCLDSLFDQTMVDFEIIAVDDGSSDLSPQILREYAAQDPRLHVILGGHLGLVAALNYAMSASSSDLLARMDADDVAAPNRLALQVQFMKDNVDCVAAGTLMTEYRADGPGILYKAPPSRNYDIDRAGEYVRLFHPTVMMRKSTVLRIGAYRAAFLHAEDCDLWFRLLQEGRICNIQEPLLKYRIHDGQVSMRQRAFQRLTAEIARALAIARATGSEPAWDFELPLNPDRAGALALLLPQRPAQIILEAIDAYSSSPE